MTATAERRGPRQVFVSDVHLEPAEPERADRFLSWLEGLDPREHEVWILGDLFDLWVADRQLRLPFFDEICRRLARVTASGLRTTFVHGNRDFFVGRRFERATGVRVQSDPIVRELQGRRFLLTHGDLLCASDRAYQRMRRVLRSRPVRVLAALLPLRAVFAIGRLLRRKSDDAIRRKSDATLAPPREAILEAAREHDCEAVVFGHLHRASHARMCGTAGIEVEVVVLGAWERGRSFARLEGGRLESRSASAGRPERGAEDGAADGAEEGAADGAEARVPVERDPALGPSRVPASATAQGRESGCRDRNPDAEGAAAGGAGHRRRVVTIDGPAGAGKSTVARRLARRLSFDFLDTGAMYRAITWRVLESGVDPEDASGVERVLASTRLDWTDQGELRVDGRVVGPEIRTAAVNEAVSRVSAHPDVRRAMVEKQRELAERRDLVAEGRDMGSVVFPNADVRFYLDADVGERARRRAAELAARGEAVDEDALRAAIEARDLADRTRDESPLRRVEGMRIVDTTGLAPDEVVARLARVALASFRGER